jgi:polyisoprenoid-binding protein YceI
MHRKILESARFPEINFRPDRVEGKVAAQGSSSVQVHGLFGIHGADHEVTAPVQAEISGDHWTATAKFTVPYQKWGMKNPSSFLLRVSDTVAIDLEMSGRIVASPGK